MAAGQNAPGTRTSGSFLSSTLAAGFFEKAPIASATSQMTAEMVEKAMSSVSNFSIVCESRIALIGCADSYSAAELK